MPLAISTPYINTLLIHTPLLGTKRTGAFVEADVTTAYSYALGCISHTPAYQCA